MAKTPTKQRSRVANNSIGYGVNGDNLRLNVPKTIHPTGRAQRIGVGLRDTRENRIQVENLCLRLNALLTAGQAIDWDNLSQYMPWKQHLVVVKPGEVKNIGWLVDSYYGTMLKPTLKESTQFNYENGLFPRLQAYRNLSISSETVDKIMQDYLSSPSSNRKGALSLLERAFDWAIQREKLTPRPNPFRGLKAQIRVTPRVSPLTGLKAEFIGFTREERNLIIDTFKAEKPDYYPIVYFLFHTGCRHGEAFALNWDDVSPNFEQIYFTKVFSSHTKTVLQGTKTDKKTGKTGRKFYCPGYLRDWLGNLKANSSSSLIFPSSSGTHINTFALSRAWHESISYRGETKYTYDGVVLKLAKAGKLAEYVSAYHTRHTFISLAIESGFDTTTIADLCGNSDSMVTNVYRSKVRNIDWNLLS